MKFFSTIILLLSTILLFDSCSIQSRRYRKGFHIESLANRTKRNNENGLQKLALQPKSENLIAEIQQSNQAKVEAKAENAIVAKIDKRKFVSPSKVPVLKSFKTIKQFKKSIQTQINQKNSAKPAPDDKFEDKFNPLAVASFVLMLSSIVLSFIPIIPGLLFLLGLIFSIVALVQLKNRPQKGRGLAIAALVIACVFLFIFLVLILAIILLAV